MNLTRVKADRQQAAKAQNNMMTRLQNIPPSMPTRAVISSFAEPAVAIIGAAATIETKLASDMPTMVYQAYSLVAADPNTRNM